MNSHGKSIKLVKNKKTRWKLAGARQKLRALPGSKITNHNWHFRTMHENRNKTWQKKKTKENNKRNAEKQRESKKTNMGASLEPKKSASKQPKMGRRIQA